MKTCQAVRTVDLFVHFIRLSKGHGTKTVVLSDVDTLTPTIYKFSRLFGFM